MVPMTNATTEPVWLTRKEAADRLRCDPKTIDRWSREGRLTKHKVGDLQSVRFRADQVDSLVQPCEPIPA